MESKNSITIKGALRDRYYSSMNHEEYSMLFGPPAPIVKPLEDPLEDMPDLCLEEYSQQADISLILENSKPFQDETSTASYDKSSNTKIGSSKRGSQSRFNNNSVVHCMAQNNHPNKALMHSQQKSKGFNRSRCMSENSEFLIFNFLDKMVRSGKKKVKVQ